MNALAAELGISVGGLYRYITTKSDLLVMACEDIYGGLLERIGDAIEGRPTAERLPTALRLYLQSCAASRRQILLMYREYRHLPPAASQRYRDREEAIVACFTELLAGHWLDSGLEARLLAQDMVLIGHLPALKGWGLPADTSPEQLAEAQISLLLRGVATGDRVRR